MIILINFDHEKGDSYQLNLTQRKGGRKMKMKKRLLVGLLTGLLLVGFAGVAGATAILTQTPQGNYASNVLNGWRWSTFTDMINTQHTINEVTGFEDSSLLSSYDAIWVDQEYTQTLTATEIINLQTYFENGNAEALVILDSNWNDDDNIGLYDSNAFAQNIVDWLANTSTKKLVLIGENDYWGAWNQNIMDIVGGGLTQACTWEIGSPTSSHSLTAGISNIEFQCASIINDTIGGADMLFSNNVAAIYESSSSVSEPATMLLLGSGLVSLAGFCRKYRKSLGGRITTSV
jgi:hypothetical protein